MAESKSRDLSIEVLTCSLLCHHVDYGPAKVDTANSTTRAISLQVTPRVCRLCMCVSRHVGNLRWLALAVEHGHHRKHPPI
jgi:hypothetical protein